MPNPYGITEVDIPGVLGAYQNQQDRRVQRLAAERQVQLQDRQLEQQDKAAAAWQKFYQGRQGAQGQQGSQGGVAGAYEAPQAPTQPAQAPQQAPDPWDDPAAQQELLASLSGTVPMAEVMQIREAFRDHSADERKAAAENWKHMAGAFFDLRQMPPAQRPAAFQQMIPMLRSFGVPDEMLAQADLSDQGLESGINQARDIEKVIEGRTPSTVPVSGVGLFPVTPGSPYPDFSAGGERPEAQIGEGTVIQNDAGEQLILRNGQWVPMGGSGGNAAGGFRP